MAAMGIWGCVESPRSSPAPIPSLALLSSRRKSKTVSLTIWGCIQSYSTILGGMKKVHLPAMFGVHYQGYQAPDIS